MQPRVRERRQEMYRRPVPQRYETPRATSMEQEQWERARAERRKLMEQRMKQQQEAMREARDATLGMPNLILPSLQVNMRAGEVPKDHDGNPMLKVPINSL